MQIIRCEEEIKKIGEIPAVAMGNFDGVHRGHHALIKECVKESRKRNWHSCVLTFEPHPQQVVNKSKAVKLLHTPQEKYRLIASLGVDYLVVLRFDSEFAQTSPEQFIKMYLNELLHVKILFIGFNFFFGHEGKGTPELLRQAGQEYGFAVSVLEPVAIDGEVVSSSLIKEYYRRGDMVQTAKLLGYQPYLTGRVVAGDGRGRSLGFPTANLRLPDYLLLPDYGVYAATLETREGEACPAVVNIGVRPTFAGAQPLVEAHVIGFNGDLYGKTVKIKLIKQLRREKKFSSSKELQEQVHQDIASAMTLLKAGSADALSIKG